MLRSKSDPRWNSEGHYSSLLGEPPLERPAEALRALDQLSASLGSAPPADLSAISLPYPSAKLKKLFDFSAFAVTERQLALHELSRKGGLSELDIDIRTAEVRLGRPGQAPEYRLAAQFMGFL
jgi:hypothetical protein